ncbi:hypothetical protein JCM21531_3586 [Acetivibrio straminisolvens JCM 21531]|jgi:hypothetical protein|uniref:Uncharacterized protein n=2 Tax=Acetivibrio straminisolvens TaxID=253314 RepID=W4VB32_9FIRM|nr:hypothetical protein JCM21531_3586 [Acetivibrio straminisolvens JCM 21531]
MAVNIKKLAKRRDIIIAFGVVAFLYCFIEYNLIFPVILGISFIGGGNFLDNTIHIIQLILGLFSNVRYILYGIGAIVVMALLCGLILSGCLYKMNNFLSNRKKMKGEFLKGIQKHFLRVSVISFEVILFSVLFAIFMLIVSVPAIAVTRSFLGGKTELLALTILFDVITLMVLFFGFMFFRIYMAFWYPAVFNFKDSFFSIGKYAADTYFWKIVVMFLKFDIAFILFEFLMIYLNSVLPVSGAVVFLRVLLLLFVNWAVKTLLFIVITMAVFSAFLKFKKKITE